MTKYAEDAGAAGVGAEERVDMVMDPTVLEKDIRSMEGYRKMERKAAGRTLLGSESEAGHTQAGKLLGSESEGGKLRRVLSSQFDKIGGRISRRSLL